ncbi:MAG: hypothetical protein GC201_13645 [Alphaproteobacteria bacterium]|nr:hypothetical protein [Alphaproteobacteria bacterium]
MHKILLLAAVALFATPAAAETCSIPPLKPIPPIGCKDLLPKCICDSGGECHWIFECIRKGDSG